MKGTAIGRFQTVLMALGALAALALASPNPCWAEQSGAIRGKVKDARGLPLNRALVVVTAVGVTPPTLEYGYYDYSDSRGDFSIANLPAARYQVKISYPRFLSITRTIQLDSSRTADLTVTLQEAPEKLSARPTADVVADQSIIWILRASRSTQPPLRFAPLPELSEPDYAPSEYSGYIQLYSGTVETVAGVADGIGSQFSVTTPVNADAKLTFRGRFSELAIESNSFEAAVEIRSSETRKSHFGISLRQSSFAALTEGLDMSREVRVQYGDSFRWSRRLSLEYGAQLGTIEAYNGRNYVRPRFAVAWSANPRTKLRVGVTTQTPAIYDAMGGKNGLDGSAYEPFSNSRRYHGEIVLAHLSDNSTVSVAVFGDHSEAQSLFAAARGERRLLVFQGRDMWTNGARVEFNHDFQDFSAGVSYTNAMGIGLSRYARSFEELLSVLKTQRFHVVTMRFHASFPLTSTELTTVYRWMPQISAVPVDPYQTFSESNEPTLSFMLAQDLPSLRPFGGKLQAVVDARNILEPSLSGRRVQLAQSPRLIKGGLNIQF
ncbi:MAG TPA: carboxypeptidase-like regulatory domain-containing protein [Terriglobia bacterium]|nr:carboxypeptidase-like regulatory domain-containing protein [Terriglobia bacterium]